MATQTKPINTASTFGWLNMTQFFGALNDNTFRWLIVFFLIGQWGADQAGRISQTIGMVFVLPFLLCTPLAGKCADHFSKQRIIVWAKMSEVGIMVLACVALFLNGVMALYALLFLMCMQSAFFGPCKYGILPELVGRDKLSTANAQLEGFTYLAVVLGTVTASTLSYICHRNYALASLVCVALSVIGAWTSLHIKATHAAGSALHQRGQAHAILRTVWTDKDLLLAVLASAYFMFLGGLMQMNLIPYGMDHLGLSREQSGYLFVLAALGIGVGSWLAGKLSGANVEVGIIPLGALGLAGASAALAFMPVSLVWVCVWVSVLGLSCGLFIVPIHALVQMRSPDRKRGQIVACSCFLGWIGVLGAALLLYGLTAWLDLSSRHIFLVMALMTAVLAVAALWRLPDFFMRFVVLVITKCCYRIKATGTQHIPVSGPALLVANHVSWADALIIGALGQRRIRFLMHRRMYESSHLKWLFKLMKVILVCDTDPPKQIIRSLKQARQALDDGQLVCIFPEGHVTRTGMLQAFKGGMERIVKGTDHPIIPIYLGGLWGSIFSFQGGKMGGFPKTFPYPVSVHVGAPLPSTTKAFELRQRVSELGSEYAMSLKATTPVPSRRFVRTARRHWSHACVSDTTGKHLTYGRTLMGSVLLAERLKQTTKNNPRVGILLPPSVAGTLANVGVSLLGKTSVNLSYVVSDQTRQQIMDQCELETVLTSRTFLAKLDLPIEDCRYLFMEDLLSAPPAWEKVKAYFKSRYQAGLGVTDSNAIATVLFSSGSTGHPKGIQLSHFNISANMQAMRDVFQIQCQDTLCGVLPFFHAFGLTASLWLPLTTGAEVTYCPNPLDGHGVGECVQQHQASIMLATPTFLLGYLRRIPPAALASLRSVVVGAEKLKPQLARRFGERFGVTPREAYGATELSPLVSINVDNYEVGNTCHLGVKSGTVGQAVPGVAVNVVDPECLTPLPPNTPGLLLVKGPNVMQGYLNQPDKTAEVLQDGWYHTGDIAAVDESGFITITDRLNRFSKIGGEMVPHIAIESICAEACKCQERLVAVTSLAHDKKGEELYVLYVDGKADPQQMQAAIAQSDLSNLCKPKPRNYLPIPNIPLLGSGKLDLMTLRKLARAAVQSCVAHPSIIGSAPGLC